METEVSDILIVIDKAYDNRLDDIVDRLKAMNMHIESVDQDEAVIEGTVPAENLAAIQKMEGVDYVRIVFTYMAEHPATSATEDAGQPQPPTPPVG